MKKKLLALVALVAGFGLSGYVIGHSGGLDAYGRHKDHTTGVYHCHK